MTYYNPRVFRGRLLQRGSGIGSLFGRLFRASVPYLKTVGQYAMKNLFDTGINTINDLQSGMKFNEAIRKNSQTTKNKIVNDIKKK